VKYIVLKERSRDDAGQPRLVVKCVGGHLVTVDDEAEFWTVYNAVDVPESCCEDF